MNQRKRVQLEGDGGSCSVAPARRINEISGAGRGRRARGVAAADTSPATKKQRRRRRPRPPSGRAGRLVIGRGGRGVARGAAGGQSFDACRASGCHGVPRECTRVMDVA